MHKPIEVRSPNQLKPETKMDWHYQNPQNLASSGIYSEKDLASLRETIMFPIEKSAVLNEFAREVHASHGISQ